MAPERADDLAGAPTSTASPFGSLDDFIAIPRVEGLALSPDGERLACVVRTLAADRAKHVTAIWEVDPRGRRPARRLTWSADGESSPVFAPGGDLFFVSKRPEAAAPAGEPKPEPAASVWALPAEGGEARQIFAPAGDVSAVRVARGSGVVIATGAVLPGPAADDARRREERKRAGVTALLHESAPVRLWDHDLGPDQSRLFVLDGEAAHEPCDLTPDPGRALDEAGLDVSADGSMVAISWRTPLGRGRTGRSLAVIDIATGERRIVARSSAEPGAPTRSHHDPAFSPDGRFVVCVEEREGDPATAPSVTLRVFDLAGGDGRDVLPDFALWPMSPVFGADARSVFFVADEQGRCPVFRVDLETGEVRRLAADGAYSALNVSPDGRFVYALRARIDQPPAPVRLDAHGVDQAPVELEAPGRVGSVPGTVEEARAVAPDGVALRGWLLLPDGASAGSPAPLALWVHGGPLMSWNSWSWRWNPWLLVARGWAVLLPDPGLSRGYGDEFIQRAWGKWGPVPFADLMAITDAVISRDDIDAERTAMMGGSYGGYMANWIAGHTDRFKAIVSHASLWTLEHFTGATDDAGSWIAEWGHPLEQPERYELNGPSHHLAAIRTPMLVVHGDKDYRVPIGEGLRLWHDLVHRGVEAKFLYFPDENHWVLKPGNAKVWYETVFAFLDHHVLGAPWQKPDLL